MLTRPALAVTAATIVLTACGGGGGSDSSPSTTVPSVPDVVEPATPFTPLPDDAAVPADDLPTPTPEPAPEPIPVPQPVPESVPSTVDLGDLEALIGRVIITWAFISSRDNVFGVVADFGPNNIVSDGSQGPALLAPFAETSGRLNGENLVGGTAILTCVTADASRPILCTVTQDGSDRTAIALNRVANGRSEGVFEFCSATTTNRECAEELVLASDGPALLTVRPVPTAKRARSGSTLDLAPYLGYADQGTSTRDERVLNAALRDQVRVIADQLDALAER